MSEMLSVQDAAQNAARSAERVSEVRYLTKSEIAQRFRVSTRTINYWMKERWLPRIQKGKILRFIPEDVDRAFAKNFGIKAK